MDNLLLTSVLDGHDIDEIPRPKMPFIRPAEGKDVFERNYL